MEYENENNAASIVNAYMEKELSEYRKITDILEKNIVLL